MFRSFQEKTQVKFKFKNILNLEIFIGTSRIQA